MLKPETSERSRGFRRGTHQPDKDAPEELKQVPCPAGVISIPFGRLRPLFECTASALQIQEPEKATKQQQLDAPARTSFLHPFTYLDQCCPILTTCGY